MSAQGGNHCSKLLPTCTCTPFGKCQRYKTITFYSDDFCFYHVAFSENITFFFSFTLDTTDRATYVQKPAVGKKRRADYLEDSRSFVEETLRSLNSHQGVVQQELTQMEAGKKSSATSCITYGNKNINLLTVLC